ncbi:glycosylphosphatidylinositol anchor biosynthesis protein 11-like isoform X1 [Daphnia pulex]|uniref:glycosylphosphatidylinositol anchor biosynthesis protein 11-like isoform X1 n=1 Tax=Daphnia pulex TaxID=6669 RepID=UPI001EE0C2B6|nr:glycosylphosphatidylinositol anchor biosynthesis protein 11-like isoform X1 [Daphnia pulex]
MQSDWPSSKKRLSEPFISNESIACIWNAVLCSSIMFWRRMRGAKDDEGNIFQFSFCFSILLVNITFCYVLSNFRHKEKLQVALFLKYGFVTSTLVYIVSILFGAPLLKDWDQTISFSMLLSALILPSVAACGKLGNFFNFSCLYLMGTNELFTCFGAWLGAFVIPLDWDCSWQVWPEPVAVGAVLGCGLSSLLKLMRPAMTITWAGYKMYWPTNFFVHERHV